MIRRFIVLAFVMLPFLSGATDRTGQGRIRTPAVAGVRNIGTAPVVSAPDFTMCASGCDFVNSNSGITSMMAAISAGDLTEARTMTPGDTEVWAANFACSGKSGSSGAPLKFKVRDGDHIKFSTSGTMLSFTNCNYWSISGGTSVDGLAFGNLADYNVALSRTAYTHGKTSECHNSTWIGLYHVTVTGSDSYESNEWFRDCDFVVHKGIYADKHGSTNNTQGGAANWGDLLHIGARHYLLEDSTIGLGGHECMMVTGSYTVVRNNDINCDWNAVIAGTNASAIDLAPANKDFWDPVTTAANEPGPALAEGNLITNGGFGNPAAADQAMKVYGQGVIVRSNYFYSTAWHPFQGPGWEDMAAGSTHAVPFTSRVQIYNNTTDDTNAVFRSDNFSWAQPALLDTEVEMWDVRNNVFQNVHTGAKSVYAWRRHGLNIPSDYGWPNAWKGMIATKNIFGGDSTNMQWALVSGTGAATVTVTDSAQWPNNIFGNSNTNLTFANGTTHPTHTRAGMALDPGNSIGIGDAVAITTTTDSGAGDTTLTLANGYPFSDGYGLVFDDNLGAPFVNMPADWIAVTPSAAGTVGTAVCTRIVPGTLNQAAGTVTVSPGITHAVGSNVWPAGNGDSCQILKNRGAAQ